MTTQVGNARVPAICRQLNWQGSPCELVPLSSQMIEGGDLFPAVVHEQ
jgi:hypothetical protein